MRNQGGIIGVGAVRFAGRCVGLGVAIGAAAAHGQEWQTGMFVSVGVSGESNPYNEVDSSGVAVAGTAELRPQARLRTDTDEIDVNGYASFRQFTRRYGLEDSYSVNGAVQSRRSERLTLRANGFFSYSAGAYGGFGRPGLSAGTILPGTVPIDPTIPVTTTPTTPVTVPDATIVDLPVPTDAVILGQRTRTTSYGTGVGFAARLNAVSTLDASLDTRVLKFGIPGLSDYSSSTAQLSYSRTLNATTSVGLIGSVGYSNYYGTRVGDSLIYSALASLDKRFSSRLSVSLAAGASIARIRQPLGLADVDLKSFNVRGQLCWQGEYSRLCANAQRSPQPSANGAVRVNDTLGMDYSVRLSPRERVSLGTNYARTGRGRGVADNQPAISFITVSGRYDNQIAERLTLFTSANASKIYGDNFSRRPNIGVSAGVQFRLGALQ